MGLILFLVIFILDRLTKVSVLTVFSDALVFNRRAFFFFDNSFVSLTAFTVLVSLLCWWFVSEAFHKPKNNLAAVASAFIAAGALGNLLDRFRYDAIIDWIPLFGISVFNIADASIVAGSLLIVISLFRGKKI